jgi:pimeloyl-ACP methyl ester carboxylesterase
LAYIQDGETRIAYDFYGDPHKKTVIFLHGIMANKKNWVGFAKIFIEKFPDFSAIVFDLKGHGESQKNLPPFSVMACAEDLVLGIKSLNLNAHALFGHSFGAKVATYVAQFLPGLSSLWLLDASPASRTNSESLALLDILQTLPWPLSSRKELVNKLLGQNVEQSFALWMTTNLKETPEGFDLVFKPNELKEMLSDFLSINCWSNIARLANNNIDIHLVKAEHGGRISLEDELYLVKNITSHAYFHELKNVGHILHVEDPEGLITLIEPYFL